MKLSHFMLIGLMSLGFAFSATAGSVLDTDSDLVPDPFDNCSGDPNGPNDASNQIDHDVDGYGTVCDGDYDDDLATGLADFNLFLADFGNAVTSEFDHDNDGATGLSDFNAFLALFGGPPGPSGLGCAGTPPCVP